MRSALAIVFLLVASHAHAQDGLTTGRAAREAGDHAAALTAFTTVWESSAAPLARAEMAIEELALGRFALAETHATEALSFASDPLVTAMTAQLTETRDAAASHLGSVEVRCPAGCVISLDRVPTGATPLAHLLRIEAGTHAIHAELEGYEPADTSVDVTAGSVVRVTLAPVWIDTRPILERGNGDGQRIAGWIAVVAAGVALVIGSVALGVQLDRDSFLLGDACTPSSMMETRESHCPGAASTRATYTDVSRAMFVSAAVLGLAGVVFLLTAPTSDPLATSARCAPSVAPGFVCQVTF